MSLLELTKQLVRIPSVTSDQEQCKLVLDVLCALFSDHESLSIERFVHEGTHSLIVKNFDGKRADICFNGHIDVVPPQSEQQWEPYERDGLLWGRGCGDMKDGVSLISLLMQELCNTEGMNKKLMLMITADEEIGGKHGVEYLTSIGYGADIVMIPDAGNREKVIIGEKGVINLTIATTGKAGHSSRPRKYDNAIEKLFFVYTTIKERIETAALHQEPEHRGCSVQLTTITGGQATNMIPGSAEGKINIRYTETTSYDTIKQTIEQIAQDVGGVSVSFDMHGSLLFTDPMNPVIQHYYQIAQQHLGTVSLEKEHGASDGRFFAEHGSVVILQKPTCFDIHGPEERTTIAELEEIYKVYKAFVLSV